MVDVAVTAAKWRMADSVASAASKEGNSHNGSCEHDGWQVDITSVTIALKSSIVTDLTVIFIWLNPLLIHLF